jgi:hypothetical protein
VEAETSTERTGQTPKLTQAQGTDTILIGVYVSYYIASLVIRLAYLTNKQFYHFINLSIMAKYKTEFRGTLEPLIQSIVDRFPTGTKATKETQRQLEEDIKFVVVDCGLAHGNTDYPAGAWLCPRNNDNSWNVRIYVVN